MSKNDTKYTAEKNVQILISLLKAHSIKKIVVSPGATNVTFVGSLQNDSYFELYSSVDERSAAYIACGLAEESGEPVALSCTGAPAARNYIPGLTEAFYRKLPVLAVTSTQPIARVGHLIPQVTDRSSIQNDIVKLSVNLPIVRDDNDIWECEVKINKALLELKRHGGGPVHINLPTAYDKTFNVKTLPNTRVIKRFTLKDELPEMKGKVAIFIGSHKKFKQNEIDQLDKFCQTNDSVVFCDHTSGYNGKYKVLYSLVASQSFLNYEKPDILIHIGEMSGDSYSLRLCGNEVWRVSEDGELRDTFKKLTNIFEMSEKQFFEHYCKGYTENKDSYLRFCLNKLEKLRAKQPEVPFSNIWIASKMAHKIPENSTIHFSILNSLRSWNFYELPNSVTSASNVGGFGTDGGVSSLIGASFHNKDRLYFGVIGDLAFFYDMNVVGNRHVTNNLRILLVNNGKGTEFRNFDSNAADFGDAADLYMSAAGHYGNKSNVLTKNYASSLGFEYLSASNKEEFIEVYESFLTPEKTSSPMIFEVFTDSNDESNALELMLSIDVDIRAKAKRGAKKILNQKNISRLKSLFDQ